MKFLQRFSAKNLYLDVCCLNRPFDDQTQNRIHLESEAVLTILSICEKGPWQVIVSEVTKFEILAIPDYDRKEKVLSLTKLANGIIQLDQTICSRANTIMNMGFSNYVCFAPGMC